MAGSAAGTWQGLKLGGNLSSPPFPLPGLPPQSLYLLCLFLCVRYFVSLHVRIVCLSVSHSAFPSPWSVSPCLPHSSLSACPAFPFSYLCFPCPGLKTAPHSSPTRPLEFRGHESVSVLVSLTNSGRSESAWLSSLSAVSAFALGHPSNPGGEGQSTGRGWRSERRALWRGAPSRCLGDSPEPSPDKFHSTETRWQAGLVLFCGPIKES